MARIEPGQFLSATEAMSLALSEARQGIATVSPNPPVGCVILSEDFRFLASGFHKQPGQPHAEIEALKNFFAGDAIPVKDQAWDFSKFDLNRLRGARFFVTLEPCSFFGRTPSCAKTLAQLPIKSLVYAQVDPHPRVQGQGLDILRQAGIEVSAIDDVEILQSSQELIEIFSKNVEHNEIFVTAKIASSLDGYSSFSNGESRWITSSAARAVGRLLRAQHDAILVGRRTIELDDPELNVRLEGFAELKKKLVILDPSAKIDLKKNWKFKNAFARDQIFHVTGSVDLQKLKIELWQQGVRSLLIEGGGVTVSHFLNQKCVDRLFVFQSSTLLGGQKGVAWAQNLNVLDLNSPISLSQIRRTAIGPDLLTTGRIVLK